jgi:leukotriene-A4 hydrolase
MKRIWGEPEVIDAAAHEFAETEEFLVAAESLTCPYMWKRCISFSFIFPSSPSNLIIFYFYHLCICISRYDVLCLPPSFPYGGMENPW